MSLLSPSIEFPNKDKHVNVVLLFVVLTSNYLTTSNCEDTC
jgi:hypothetical protein